MCHSRLQSVDQLVALIQFTMASGRRRRHQKNCERLFWIRNLMFPLVSFLRYPSTFSSKTFLPFLVRKIINSEDKTGLDIILFQFQTCPFCCKVRSFLDYSGLSYSVVEVDAVLRQSIKWSPSKKVPTMLVRTHDGKYVQLNDSSMIISALASYLIDPAKNKMEELVKFYPVENFTDVYGTVYDIANKYFLMFQDKKPKDNKEVFE